MHYLEDLIEYLDDLPEELRDRLYQIREWDETVESLQAECSQKQELIFSPNSILPVEEKQQMALDVAEKLGRMKALAQKKAALAERCCVLFDKLYKKASESMEAFQAELAVDNPGVVDVIQEKFNREHYYRQHCGSYSASETATPFESDESGRSTPDLLVPNPLDRKNILKERNNKNRFLNGKPYTNGNVEKKRPGRKPGKDGKISDYMRRKQEKIREQARMIEMARERDAARAGEMNKNGLGSLMLPSSTFDLANFCEQDRTEASSPATNADLRDAAGGDDDGNDFAIDSMFDLLGEDDQLREGVEVDPSQFDFISGLGKDERDLVESMNNGGSYGFDDELMSGLGAGSSSQSPMYSHGSFEASSSSTLHSSPSPIKLSASTSGYSTSDTLSDEKKKKKITFSVTSDTSLHGRPRKLTDRAAQKVQQVISKQNKKLRGTTEYEEWNSPDAEKWCYCRLGTYGCMIACDNPKCKLEWFHLECVGLTASPAGSWYCALCRPDLHPNFKIPSTLSLD